MSAFVEPFAESDEAVGQIQERFGTEPVVVDDTDPAGLFHDEEAPAPVPGMGARDRGGESARHLRERDLKTPAGRYDG